jgi:spermidine synthase
MTSALFVVTLFVSSALLFVLEPLVAKGLLPVMGGGAAVWTTTAAFFQLALLAGYLYAHVGPSWLGMRRQAWLHVILLIAATVVCARFRSEPPDVAIPSIGSPALGLFEYLTRTIGFPFVLLSASTPLLHRWLAERARIRGREPYFLFAASNAGSLGALLAYPVVIEPLLGLEKQRQLWAFALFPTVALIAGCAAVSIRSVRPQGRSSTITVGRRARTSWATRGRWLILAAVPSSLLLSLTTYVTTDIAALPLLWVLPLAVYLLTFVLAFGAHTPISSARVLWLQPFFLIPIAVEFFLKTTGSTWPLIPLHGLAFFLMALGCHQALAASRPDPARASEFYLWVAAGGALGALFNVFVAPVVFPTLLEYPLGLVAAAMLRMPQAHVASTSRAHRFDVVLPVALGTVLLVATWVERSLQTNHRAMTALVGLIVPLSLAGAAVFAFRARPLRFGLALAALCGVGLLHEQDRERVVYNARSFYAVHTVVDHPPSSLRTLSHGSTVHGAQDLAPGHEHEALTYYSRTGPIGDVMAAWQGRPQRKHVAVVGLGTGALAAYSAPHERWTFFEIDSAVVQIARNQGLFTYLSDARGDVDVIVGDARRTLTQAADASFGILVLDAFSSDAIPAHLLTREAFALYLRKLIPGGLIAFHISNRYLDLEPVIGGAAASFGLTSLTRADHVTENEVRHGKTSSIWMVMARAPGDLRPLSEDGRWASSRQTVRYWTDDKSDLWSTLRFRASEVFDFAKLSR